MTGLEPVSDEAKTSGSSRLLSEDSVSAPRQRRPSASSLNTREPDILEEPKTHVVTPAARPFLKDVDVGSSTGQRQLWITAGLAGLWVLFTTVSATCSGQFLQRGGDPLFLSMMTCGLGALPMLWLRKPGAVDLQKGKSESLALEGLLHFCNSILTNVGLGLSSVTTIYSLKCLEPVACALLYAALRGHVPTIIELGLITSISGTMFFAVDGNIDASDQLAIVAGLSSVVIMALRSIIWKASLSRRSEDPLYFYAGINAQGLLFSLLFLRPSHFTAFGTSLNLAGNRGSLFWALVATLIYNYLSIYFLQRLSPVTHSICSVLKRASTLGWDMFAHPYDHELSQRISLVMVNLFALLWVQRSRFVLPGSMRPITQETSTRRSIHPFFKLGLGFFALLLTLIVTSFTRPGIVRRPLRQSLNLDSPSAYLASTVTAELEKARTAIYSDLSSSELSLARLQPPADSGDVGNFYSSPFMWLAQLNETGPAAPSYYEIQRELEVPFIWDQVNPNDVIIMGGGAFLKEPDHTVEYQLDRTLNTLHSGMGKLIGWGVGFNNTLAPGQKRGDYFPQVELAEEYTLLGVRDRIPGYRWVPCASAMAPAFDRAYPLKRTLGLYKEPSYRRPIPDEFGDDEVRLTNELDFDATIEFLGSSEIIVTSSYHGLYWASLLGRKVVLLEIQGRNFDYFPFPPVRHTGNLTDDVARAKTYPYALKQARKANLAFWHDVRDVLNHLADELDHM